ncbi:armadillo-type protein [Delphinella strobiligena]|nr:armadillo-type protein [Delphinella strobiligena]
MARLRKRATTAAAPVEPEPELEVQEEQEEQEAQEAREEQEEQEEANRLEEQQSVEGAPHVLRFNEALTWRAGKPIAVAELLRRLKSLHQELSELEQEDADRDSLVPIAQQLAQHNLLGHKDRGIKAWTTLCIVEMFKLLAPNAPFKPSQLKGIFSLIIEELLPALANPADPYNEQHLQVIRSLDEVKSIVLLTDIPAGDSLVYKLFVTAFDIFADNTGEELNKNVEHHISSLLITVVDESSTLPTDAVEIILAQFLRVDPSTFPLNSKKPPRNDEQRGLFHLQQLPPAYAMAKNICISCPDKMARMVSQYFNSIINRTADELDGARPRKASTRGKSIRHVEEDEDDAAHHGPSDEELNSLAMTHRLLRELWRSSATVIQNIVPQLEAELTAENIHVRLLATETVGDLISGIGAAGPPPPATWHPAAYPSQSSRSVEPSTKSYDFLTTPSAPHAFSSVHPTSYQHFMNRRHDKSPLVRAIWVTCAGRILSTSAGGVGLDPQEEEDLLSWVADMLLDTDERVRLASVKAIGYCDFYTIVNRIGSSGSVTDQGSVLFNLAHRIKDPKHNVRVEAMALLGRIWGVAAGAITEGNDTVRSLLGAIPSRIFEAIYVNDVEINALVQQVLTDSLLPLSFPPIKKDKVTNGDSQRVKDSQNASSQNDKAPNPDAMRAERVLVLLRDLEQRAKTVFFALQARQTKQAQYIEAFLKQCELYNGGVGKAGKEASDRLGKLIDFLARQRPEPITSTEHLWKFAKKHDRRCYQLIRFAISPDSDYKKVYNACKELKKRIEDQPGSNAAILATLLPVVHLGSLLAYNKSHVPTMIELARAEGSRDLEDAARDVLKEISEHNPEVFKAHIRTLCAELERQVPAPGSPSDPGAVETLKACAGFGQRYPSEIPRSRDFLRSMVEFALHGNPSQAAKHAVSVIVAADEKKDMYVKEIVTKCTEDFEYGSEGFLSRLAALSQLMLLSAKDIEEEHDTIVQIAIQQILMQVRTEAKDDDPSWQTELDDECAAKVWALKMLTNRLRSYANSVSDAEMEEIVEEHARPVFKLLNSIIKGDGEISKNDPTPKHHRAHLRLTAAILLLKLCSAHKRLDTLLTASDFNRLAIIVQDALPEVRAAFITRVKKHLGQARLPHRFYTLVFLLAYEPNISLKDSTATWLRGRAAAFTKTNDTAIEATFARFLSLLAHHPDFSMELENLQDFVEYIMFYLKTVASQANVATVFHLAQRLKSVQDGIDPAVSDNLYTLSDIAQSVVRSFADAQGWSITTLSGKIRLPSGLFAQLPSHSVAQNISETVYAPEELIENIDDLVRASLRTRKRKVDTVSNQTKKRIKTSENKAPKPLPTRKPAKPVKVAKTPRKLASASAGATPSTEIRRSTRGSTKTRNYAENDESEDDEELEEWNQAGTDQDNPEPAQSDESEAGPEEQESPAPRSKAEAATANGSTTNGRTQHAAGGRKSGKIQPRTTRKKTAVELLNIPDDSDDEGLSDPPSDMEVE